MADKEQYSAAVVCGVAKRIATELEQLPMETHQAVVSMVANLFQHRGLQESRRIEDEKREREMQREKTAASDQAFLLQRQQLIKGSASPDSAKPLPVEVAR